MLHENKFRDRLSRHIGAGARASRDGWLFDYHLLIGRRLLVRYSLLLFLLRRGFRVVRHWHVKAAGPAPRKQYAIDGMQAAPVRMNRKKVRVIKSEARHRITAREKVTHPREELSGWGKEGVAVEAFKA